MGETRETAESYNQILLSTASFFGRFNTEQALMEMARMGLHQAEVFLSGYYEYTAAYFDLLDSMMSEHQMQCVGIHTLSTQFEPQLFSNYSRQYDSAEELFRRILEGGKRLGASHYVMHGPIRVKKGGRIHMDDAGSKVLQLGKISAEYAITLTLENVHWCLVQNPQTVNDLNSYVDGEVVGYTFDVKQAVQSGHLPVAYLDAMGGTRLKNVHLCGTTISSGEIKTGMPVAESPEMQEVAKKLRDMQYTGPIVLEVYAGDYRNLSDLLRCREELNDLFYGKQTALER